MAVDETGAQVGKKKNCVRRSGLRLLQSVTCPFRSWHSLSGYNTYFTAFIGINEFIQARTRIVTVKRELRYGSSAIQRIEIA